MDFEQWMRSVLDNEGLSSWTVKPSLTASCCHDSKTIEFPLGFVSRASFLCEVTHAICKHSNYGVVWAETYAYLVEKYLSRSDYIERIRLNFGPDAAMRVAAQYDPLGGV